MKPTARIFPYFLILVLLLAGLANLALAKNEDSGDQEIPEVDGIYDVPGHANMKVRVIVHHAKPARPEPVIVCATTNDPGSDAFVGATGWKLPSSFSYNLNPLSAPSALQSQVEDLTARSFAAWDSVTDRISISRGNDTFTTNKGLDGKNLVAWGRPSGSALAVTYTWYYPSTGEVVEIDTIMNKKFAWSWTPYDIYTCVDANAYDAQNIMTHEIGHWFGLNDFYTSNYVDNTMFGYGSKAELKKDTLTTGDIAGLAAIYP